MIPRGVLLTAFGGPGSLEEVGPFMCDLMGREPSGELVERAKAKYALIGGCSPLPAMAARIASALEALLAEKDTPLPVRLGMRYSAPTIAEAMEDLASLGAREIITVSLSPFESNVAAGAYRRSVGAAAETLGLAVTEARQLQDAPQFAEFLGRACGEAVGRTADLRTLAIMTAHSLPLADLVEEDPYVEGLARISEEVAGRAGLGSGSWTLAYQSKGARPGGWLEPDIEEVLRDAAANGYEAVAVCPIGFATDHMETLYDLDTVAAGTAGELGLDFQRADVPNDDPLLIEALAALVGENL